MISSMVNTVMSMMIGRSDVPIQINACSELYIDIINKQINCLKARDVEAVWALIRDISRVVMGDAPLLDIFSASYQKKGGMEDRKRQDGEEEEEEEDEESR